MPFIASTLLACGGPQAHLALDKPAPEPPDFALPAEFEPVDRVLVGFEAGGWDHLPYFTELAEAMAPHARIVITGPAEDRAGLARHLAAVGVPPAAIEELDAPVDTMWIRDYGPLFVRARTGELAVVDPPYHDDRRADDELPARVAALEGLTHVRTKLPLEGGHLQADGGGRCVLTRRVLTVAERDLGLDEAAVERELHARFGCDAITWVPALRGEETAHLDVFALITGPGRILVGRYDAPDDPENAAILDEAARLLAAAGFAVTRIPMPPNERRSAFATHTNALILEGAVLVPVYGRPHRGEQDALRIFGAAFPTRRIVPVEASGVMALAGAVRCTTRPIPRE